MIACIINTYWNNTLIDCWCLRRHLGLSNINMETCIWVCAGLVTQKCNQNIEYRFWSVSMNSNNDLCHSKVAHLEIHRIPLYIECDRMQSFPSMTILWTLIMNGFKPDLPSKGNTFTVLSFTVNQVFIDISLLTSLLNNETWH